MNNHDYSADIAKALRTEGGHLFIGRGGFSLHYANGYLSGYACETVKAQAVAAGLPVIDSRRVEFDAVTKLVVEGPLVAVGRAPDPKPWLPFSYAPLIEVARAYAAERAEVYNLPLDGAGAAAGKEQE
jgi:hypothetical protein